MALPHHDDVEVDIKLKTLSETSFNDGLVAGVPAGTITVLMPSGSYIAGSRIDLNHEGDVVL